MDAHIIQSFVSVLCYGSNKPTWCWKLSPLEKR